MLLLFIGGLFKMFTSSNENVSPTNSNNNNPSSPKEKTNNFSDNSSLPETPLTNQNPQTTPKTLDFQRIDQLLDKIVAKETNLDLKNLPYSLKEQINEIKAKLTPQIFTFDEEKITKLIKKVFEEKPLQSPIPNLPKLEPSKPISKYVIIPIIFNKSQQPNLEQETKTINQKAALPDNNIPQSQPEFSKQITALNEEIPLPIINSIPIPTITPQELSPFIVDSPQIKEQQNLPDNPIISENKEVISSIIENPNQKLEEKEDISLPKEQEKTQEKESKEKKLDDQKQEEKKLITIPDFQPEILKLKAEFSQLKAEEDFENKNYDNLITKINALIEKINNYYLQYENLLTPEQKNKLLLQEDKLRQMKKNISFQKNKDIATEENLLEENVKSEEIESLQNELEKLYFENEQDIQKFIPQIEDIEKLTNSQRQEIEKQLIKLKLKKASKALELPLILSLPFVRNRYFAFFTAGIFINNHFNFLNRIFKRQTIPYTKEEFYQIKKGQDLLNSAINTNYENIIYLNYLEKTALQKYPELINDYEFMNYLTKLKHQLNKNYQYLMHKQQILEKHCRKTKSNIKVLRKLYKVA